MLTLKYVWDSRHKMKLVCTKYEQFEIYLPRFETSALYLTWRLPCRQEELNLNLKVVLEL